MIYFIAHKIFSLLINTNYYMCRGFNHFIKKDEVKASLQNRNNFFLGPSSPWAQGDLPHRHPQTGLASQKDLEI